MLLWVDDLRDPAEYVGNYYWERGWVWSTNYKTAIRWLTKGVDYVTLDNDLGGKKEGRHILLWMIEHNTWPDLGVGVHSANPVARATMEEDIRTHYFYTHYTQVDNVQFRS